MTFGFWERCVLYNKVALFDFFFFFVVILFSNKNVHYHCSDI